VCHQTVSLIARALEGNGLPTMILGSAFDILQSGWAPRATFLDYPLGHSAGMPFDRADQLRVTRSALLNLEALREPGLIVQLPSRWAGDADWKAAAATADEGDVRAPRDETPRYQFEEDRIAAERAGAAD
jgi:hypothetical protein